MVTSKASADAAAAVVDAAPVAAVIRVAAKAARNVKVASAAEPPVKAARVTAAAATSAATTARPKAAKAARVAAVNSGVAGIVAVADAAPAAGVTSAATAARPKAAAPLRRADLRFQQQLSRAPVRGALFIVAGPNHDRRSTVAATLPPALPDGDTWASCCLATQHTAMMTEPPPSPKELLTTNRKALTINLANAIYGTFAEIGAGQEVARCFFQAGGASGTVAKTISAYDMTFSDAIYGKAPRYVSRERLFTMLDHEYELLVERLGATRGENTQFFVFADTVAARNYTGTNECHGWMGVRFQIHPGEAPNDVLIHVRMWDKENVLQQQALGIIGVNLIYGAFCLHHDPKALVASLADNLGTDRIEVDMVKFSGPAFARVDNRLLSLFLVEFGLTNAVLFGPDGDVQQPSEVLRKKAVLVERGSFRPITKVHLDMLRCATAQFAAEPQVQGKEMIVLAELTVHNLLADGQLDAADFLARVDLLAELGLHVLISNYSVFFRLTQYFRRYSGEMIGIALGINNLLEVFNERYYENLPGGILESFGRLFRNEVRLYVYPMFPDALAGSVAAGSLAPLPAGDTALVTADNLPVAPHLRHLYAYLHHNRHLVSLTGYDAATLAMPTREVLHRIQAGDPSWEELVPPPVAAHIKRRGLFGVAPQPDSCDSTG